MRKCVLLLSVLSLVFGAQSCGTGSIEAPSEAPELLQAVPSDAQCAGIFGRLDHALDDMIDSSSVMFKIDYGRLGRARTVIALCDVGSLAPLVIVEAGKASADTLAAAASVLAQADTIGIPHAHVSLVDHNTLLLTPSETVLTIAERHLASETSILDAPDFDKVLPVLTGSDARVYRSRGASKLFGPVISGNYAPSVIAFLREASEWLVVYDNSMTPVWPDAEKYFASFCSSLQEAPSKLGGILPADSGLYVDIPIASVLEYRRAYEVWLDARVALESYNKRLSGVWRATGIDPRAWEIESGVKEAAVATLPGGVVNMLRVSGRQASDGIVPNPRTGFASALYGSVFEPADSCMLCSGNWILSGSRAALESYSSEAAMQRDWPAKAKAVAGRQDIRFTWNKDNNIKIWHSNR